MSLSKTILMAAIACVIQVSQVSGQQFVQSNYLQQPAPESDVVYYGDQYAGETYGGEVACEEGEPNCFETCLDDVTVGGWAQIGYHSADLNFLFNQHSDRLRLHQLWFHIEKDATGRDGFDIGGRFDYVYGVDAQDTQAFGIANDHWDNDWDNGIYGSAIPQAYGEVAYGDTSLKVGHFYTIIGYEVVTAPDNFFYSHAYTMFNSEPFTHTGALVTHNCGDYITAWGGYTYGWDSGFEDNGDAALAGLSLVLTDSFTLTYTGTYGRFNERKFTGNLPERGEMHSIVASTSIGALNHVMQVDRLNTSDPTGAMVRDTIGINNYLLYEVCDAVSTGIRFEWYNVARTSADRADIYALTYGLNVRTKDFLTIRPEVRWDWDADAVPLGALEVHPVTGLNRSNQMTFGVDAIVVF